ncbi:MAG: glycosyltransferase family 4 protein [Candidatus Omnitrophica bacterium]|nr:glycosyltransferase family 4 protein [Candidatus Omnitrophota bacterium]
MTNLLGITLDFLMLQDDKVRGDVRLRQIDYSKQLDFFNLIVYSSSYFGSKPQEWSDNLWIYPTNSKSKINFVWDALKIGYQICKNKKINVITAEDPFTTGLIGLLLKKRYKIPLNIQSHVDFCDNPYWVKQRKMNRFFNLLGKFILKRADSIRVGTNYEKEKLARILRINKDKISVIPVNSDLSKFKDVNGESIRKKYLNGRFDKILLFSGRLVPQKDIPTLLRAFQIIKQARSSTLLLIVGSGTQENFLKNLAQELQIQDNLIFTGSIEHNKLPEYLAGCDVYTISSIFEGTCIAMAEAMASAKPVVATKFAGAYDLIVNGQTGFTVSQEDYETFADKVLYLLDNPDMAKTMGEKASKKAEEIFSDNQNIGKVIKMWELTAKC